MQEEIEQKSFNIMISTTKLSAQTVLRAVKAAFRLYQSKTSQGKQSVRTLLRQNRGVSSVEISKTGIRGLERYAKKYGIDYAIRKDTSEVPPRYLVFFKAPDAEAFNSAFKEYSASLLNKDKRPSVLAKLHELVPVSYTHLEGMKHSSTAQTMRHLRVEVMELCEGAGLYQIDLLNGSKERVNEAEYWARRRGQQKLDLANAALTVAGQQPRQKKFETVKDTLRRQISSVLYRATSFEDFSDRLLQQYGIAVKESRGQLSYLPAGRTKFIRAKHLGDKFDKAEVLATLQANAERKPKVQFKQDTIGKLIDIQSRMTEGKGIGLSLIHI